MTIQRKTLVEKRSAGMSHKDEFTTKLEKKCRSIQVPQVDTVPKQLCTNVPEQKCSTVSRQQCHTVNEQECSTRYEQECQTQLTPVQKYREEEECNTQYEQECNTRYEQVCNTVAEKECTLRQVVIKESISFSWRWLGKNILRSNYKRHFLIFFELI